MTSILAEPNSKSRTGERRARQLCPLRNPVEGGGKRRCFAVLQFGVIESPLDTVRAAIVVEHRGVGHGR